MNGGYLEMKGFMLHLYLRTLALVQGLFYVKVKDWAPAPHGPDENK